MLKSSALQQTISEAILPSADLRPWIDFYIRYQHSASTPSITQLPSSATATLTLVLEGRLYQLQNSQRRPLPSAFFSGTRINVTEIQSDGPLSCLILAFAPGNWHQLIRLPPVELSGLHPATDSLSLYWPEDLLAQLQASPIEQHLDLVERTLRSQCGLQHRPSSFTLSETAWLRDQLLWHSPCQVARSYGLSLRQLERRFLQSFGLSPKQYQRLARHALLLTRLGNTQNKTPPLANLAAELGFADQSHMTRDMKHFTGILPGQFKTLIEQQQNYWAYRILPEALGSGSGMSRFFKP